MRSLFLSVSLLLLVGCDSSAPGPDLLPETAASADSWISAIDAPAKDIFFSALSTRPGGVIRAMIEASPGPNASRLTLSSARSVRDAKHHITLHTAGVEVEQAELFIRRLEDEAFVSIHSADNTAELSGGTVDREPASFHYEEITYEDGSSVWMIHYDYHQGGGTFRSPFTEGETEIDHVGYRVQFKEQGDGFSRLRIDGYDKMAISSMQVLREAELRGRVIERLQADG